MVRNVITELKVDGPKCLKFEIRMEKLEVRKLGGEGRVPKIYFSKLLKILDVLICIILLF